MDAEFVRELIERQKFGVPHMLRQSRTGALDEAAGNCPDSAVPHTKCVQGHAEDFGEFFL